MAVLLVAGFMNLIDVTIVNVALPRLQSALDASESQIEWVVAGYILTFALFLLPAGRAGDIWGRRRMFVWGVAVFTVGSALCGLAPSIGTLIGARVVQAIGGAMMTPQTLAIVPIIFPPSERGTVYALFGLSAGLATVTGPVLGGVLIKLDLWGLDWRPIFLVNIPIGVAAILLAFRFVPRTPGTARTGFDAVGVGLAAVALLLVVFPLIEGRLIGWPGWILAMLAGSVPVAAIFVWWQRRQAEMGRPQLLPARLMDNRDFLLGTGLVTVLFSCIPGFFLVIALYLQNGYGLTPLQSGLTTLPFSIGGLIASVAAGWMGNRWLRPRICIGALMLAVAMGATHVVVATTGDAVVWTAFAGPLFLGGLGLSTTISPLFNTTLSRVSGADTGSASGALQTFQQVGGALGVALQGQIFFSTLAGAAGMPGHDAYATAFGLTLFYTMGIMALMAALTWVLPRPDIDGA